MKVDRHADRALYLQLADVLRDDIEHDRLKPGERLPSETELIKQHGVSRGTAREAISILRNEGIVVVEHGRGAFVRTIDEKPLDRRVVAAGRYSGARHTFERDVADAGRVASVRTVSTAQDGAPPSELANGRLAEHPMPRTAWLGFADGRPITLTTTWRTADEAADGDRVEEHLSARMPSRDERRLLQLDDGAPVLLLNRVLYKGSAVVEASSSVIAATRQRIVYGSRA